MKSKITLFVAVIIAAMAVPVVLAGCSKHEAELSETNAEAMAALESYLADQEAEENDADTRGPDPNAPVLEIVSVYIPKKDGTGISQIMDGVDTITPEALFQIMTNEGLDMSDVEVKSWKTADKTGTLELTSLKDKSHKMQVCLINTFTENYGLDAVTIIADGETLVTNGEYESKFKKVE